MKKIMIKCIALLAAAILAGCKGESHEGIYVATLKSHYSVAEDTIELKGDIIINRVGYKRLIDGQLKNKEFSVKNWRLNSPDAPIIELGKNQITIGRIQYKKIK
ncbi:hypothetical protein LT679_00565 [Mucilaginibacter roseus]|uniref:Lipoprotein n=1 Tax=Mucilaginibacter roseus TaxID=1528868 RepID=A0ABS8TW15_9SPHI|nr:hypothetical protein [Mucilaginibacter roseus]MCD8739078.1 hypothetical protein [Mucilaginibacter roseus]